MDSNQTRFQLLLGLADWGSCTLKEGGPVFAADSPLEWSSAQHELHLRSIPYRFQAPPNDSRPDVSVEGGSRRGTGADAAGNIYWIAQDRLEIRRQWAGKNRSESFWSAATAVPPSHSGALFEEEAPPASPPPKTLSGLTVTEDHYLVAGTLDPPGLLVFDLLGGGAGRIIRWPRGVPFAPFDLAPRAGGGVWILDRVRKQLWALDRALRCVPHQEVPAVEGPVVFGPSGTSLAPRKTPAPTLISADYAWPTTAQDPVAIEALPDGSLLILDAPAGGVSRILRAGPGTEPEEVIALDFAAYDFVFVAQGEVVRWPGELVEETPDAAVACFEGVLMVASAEGNQSFAFELRSLPHDFTLELAPDYQPMRRFGGKGLVAARGKTFYDFGDRWLPLIAQPHPQHTAAGTLETRAFDGHEPHCVWHRLILEACLPMGAEVEVWSRAADEPRDLALAEWAPEPPLQRRATGSELPYLSPATAPQRACFELLIQSSRGRYAQLRLRLSGDGRATPRLHALRFYYPRFSYLTHYLPKVYRQDTASASFLDRFLANFEGTNTAIEDRIAAAQVLFDARTAPAETLSWLASWFGLALDPAWEESRRRLLLAHAMTFFQWRGTVRGLKMALRLALEEEPDDHIFDEPGSVCRCADRFRVLERFLARRKPRLSPQPPGLDAPLFAPAAPPAAPAAGTLGFTPSDTSAEIGAWRDFVQSREETPVDIPVDQPSAPVLARLWRDFQLASDSMPFGQRRRAWQQFLVRRYVGLAALNQAHRTHWDSFAMVAYPAEPPVVPAVFQDWSDFETMILPALEVAHRFTVLLPLTRAAATNYEERTRVLTLATQLIELEKPAHTACDVKFFTAHFRLGETRLGDDSVLSRGGRDPAVLAPTILGRSQLGESFITPGTPPLPPGRVFAGHVRLKDNPPNRP